MLKYIKLNRNRYVPFAKFTAQVIQAVGKKR